MKIISKPQAGGKTTEIIKACAEQGGYIVCANMKAAGNVHYQAKHMGLSIPHPITFLEFIEKRYHAMGVKKFHIDNIDICLQQISRAPIATVSITSDTDDVS